MAAGGILRRIGIALGVEVNEDEAKKSVDSIKSFAMKALGTIAVGVSIAKVNALANEFGAVNKIIKNATRDLGDQADIQNKILEAANLTKSSYADTAKTVSALVQENTDLFGNVDEAVKFNNAATMLFKTAGKTDDEIAELMESINKSFAKGAVDSETVSQLLERSPEAVALLEQKLGTTKDKFEKLVSDGKVSLKDLKEAFTDSSDEIEKRFLESGVSINDALKNIRNQWGLYVAQIWNGAGVSQHVGKLMVRAFNDFMSVMRKAQPMITRALTSAMNWLTKIADWISKVGSFLGRLVNHIGGVENAIKLLLIVAGAIWLAFNFEKIVNGFVGIGKAIKGLFSPKNFKTAAIVAAIVLIALVVEDFINFLKGNDSVLGTIFDKLGIDSQKVRETIIGCFNKVKQVIGDVISKVGKYISDHKDQLASLGKFILIVIGQVIAGIALIKTALAVIPVLSAAISFLTSPIGLVIAAIAALIAIGVLLYKNWDTIKEYAANLKASIVSAFEQMKAGVSSKVAEITTTVVNGFNAAISWIKGLPAQAVQWGADFIDGIARGIKSAAGKVTDSVKGIADNIKSFLHFSRPDTGPLADYETWMPDFVNGLSRTLKGNKGKLLRTALDVSQALDIRPNLQTRANVAGASRNGTVITQNIEVNNTVKTTDAKAGKEASKQMNKSGNDITKQITKGLNYGRP